MNLQLIDITPQPGAPLPPPTPKKRFNITVDGAVVGSAFQTYQTGGTYHEYREWAANICDIVEYGPTCDSALRSLIHRIEKASALLPGLVEGMRKHDGQGAVTP